jgi:hypothetical protein
MINFKINLWPSKKKLHAFYNVLFLANLFNSNNPLTHVFSPPKFLVGVPTLIGVNLAILMDV